MTEIYGQHVRQQQRVEDYQRWSGATPVNKDGTMKAAAATSAEPHAALVTQELAAIRAALAGGVKVVHLDISHAPTIAAIKEQLTAEERHHVRIGEELLG